VSSAEVASSKINMGGFFSNALEIANRCFCPPESLAPLSPINVSKPFRVFSINSSAFAALAAAWIASSLTSC